MHNHMIFIVAAMREFLYKTRIAEKLYYRLLQ